MAWLQQERVQSVVGVMPDSSDQPGETVRAATGESYPTTSRWQPFHEPLRHTLLRNGAIAILVGAVIARFWGGLPRWPLVTLLALWPSLGGHWVEVWFLNWLRPRIPAARRVQVAARFVVPRHVFNACRTSRPLGGRSRPARQRARSSLRPGAAKPGPARASDHC